MLIVNPEARIGANCHIFNGVVIGMEHRYYSGDAPVIGNNIYIGPGAKIFGPITIADNIAIGVNAVVNKSFMEPGITIAGVPARKISDKGSEKLITKGSEIARIRMSSHTR
jgi:serine O-acetyltransferase